MNRNLFLVTIFKATLLLSACSSPVSNNSADGTYEPVAEALPPAPVPNYASIDGDEYLYKSGLSEKDKEEGRAVAEVISFRFLGEKEGKITLKQDIWTLRCDNPCDIITATTPYGNKERITFEPGSVVGGAFTDAMNGFLVEHPSNAKKVG